MKDYCEKDYCEWCHQADGLSYPKLASTFASSRSILCALCSRAIVLIDIRHASEIAQKSRKTIYQWIETERIKTVLFADGRRLICYSSLFLPAKQRLIMTSQPGLPKKQSESVTFGEVQGIETGSPGNYYSHAR